MSAALQAVGCGALLGFGFVYNAYVQQHIERGTGDFQARFVALGCAAIIGVEAATNWGRVLTGGEWLPLTLVYFACGGLGMGLGSWQRRRVPAAE